MINIDSLISGNKQKLLDLIKHTSRAHLLKSGTIIKAEVIKVDPQGDALLRLLPQGGNRENIAQITIKASPQTPLTKGQHIFLEVQVDKDNLTMQLIGSQQRSSGQPVKFNPPKFLELLARLSESKLSQAEIKTIIKMIKSMPDQLKSAMPEILKLEKDLVDRERSIDNRLTARVRNLITLTAKADKAPPFRTGEIIKAEVIKITRDGLATLRISDTSHYIPEKSGNSGYQPKDGTTIIRAYSKVPLVQGQKFPMEVLGGGKELNMRVLGNQQTSHEVLQQNVPVRFLEMLSSLSSSRMNNSDFKLFLNLLRLMPRHVKTAVPEFQKIENLIAHTKKLDGKTLKAFVESSGVAFETKVKVAMMNDPSSLFQTLFTLNEKADLKAALLRLRRTLTEQRVINILSKAGYKAGEIALTAERIINNIEFFQLSSKINDMFYTFLPLMWENLRDGEIMFRKNKGANNSYTCDINLDLESIGKLSISVMMSNRSFYVSFNTEKSTASDLIKSHKSALEERFSSKGLMLKALNIGQKKSISFGQAQPGKASIKV